METRTFGQGEELKNLLVEQLQDLMSAETQILQALPRMIEAAHEATLKLALEKHGAQTEGHVERLRGALGELGQAEKSEPCKGMQGLLQEGQEQIEDSNEQDELVADLALIAAAQKVEHYEISGYGTARCLARQLNELQVARLLSHTLGEEESADFILTEIAKPILQQASSQAFGSSTKTPWGEPGNSPSAAPDSEGAFVGRSKVRAATASAGSGQRPSEANSGSKAKKGKR